MTSLIFINYLSFYDFVFYFIVLSIKLQSISIIFNTPLNVQSPPFIYSIYELPTAPFHVP